MIYVPRDDTDLPAHPLCALWMAKYPMLLQADSANTLMRMRGRRHHNDSDVETTLLYCSNYMDVAVHFVMRESQIRFFLQCFQAGIITDNL